MVTIIKESYVLAPKFNDHIIDLIGSFCGDPILEIKISRIEQIKRYQLQIAQKRIDQFQHISDKIYSIKNSYTNPDPMINDIISLINLELYYARKFARSLFQNRKIIKIETEMIRFRHPMSDILIEYICNS